MNNIHPTAIIDPSAKLDPSVKVGPYTVIREDVVGGAGTVIGAHAVLEFVHMGKDNIISDASYIGVAPQDLKYAGEPTRLVMGERNQVREGVTLNRGTKATGETRIGSGCMFMALSHVAHDCRIGDGVILVNSVGLAGHVEIGDYVVVGGLCGVHQFVRIGRLCMVSGGSMVGKDVPPFCTAQGDRASLRGLNSLGLRRAGIAPAAVRAIKNAYATLFSSGLRLEEAVAQLRSSKPCPEVVEMLDFIAQAKRGVMRPLSGVEEDAGVEA